jgi:serine/threonine protein phosphatase PrpC
MRIDIGPVVELKSLDTVFLGTDGVSDNLNVSEMTDLIRAGDLKDCCESLRLKIQSRMEGGSSGVYGKPDDLAYILFRPRKDAS